MNQKFYPHPFFAREGWPFIGGTLIVALLVQLFAGGWAALIFWVLFAFVLQFFRDPCREPPADPQAVVSPVDGRVIKIEETVCPYTGDKARVISIFMNVFNVHSQKAPVSGKIDKIEYWPGKFLNASLDKASELNERNAVTVTTESGARVCFVQIAGRVARRILCYKQIGEAISRGERYGFIRFGSRVDVYIPLNWDISVTIGQKVTGVATQIAVQKP